ncbi:hypothetical protein FEO92_04240 [Stenotrophomonas maltophilia]|nr:hypothetical protein FEO92_04240 [Stenotrophomonas maltophilia]
MVDTVDPRHAWMLLDSNSKYSIPMEIHPRMAWILSLADLAPWLPRARRGRPCGSRSCDREVAWVPTPDSP